MTTARTLPLASALRMLRTMRIIREFEDAAGAALRDGHARGSVHQYTGEEAIATGVCFNLARADFVLGDRDGTTCAACFRECLCARC